MVQRLQRPKNGGWPGMIEFMRPNKGTKIVEHGPGNA